MPTPGIAECKRPGRSPSPCLCESSMPSSPSPGVVSTRNASHPATGSWPATCRPPRSSSTATRRPSISARTTHPLHPKNAPLQLQPLRSGDGTAKRSKRCSQTAGTPRVKCRAMPWTDFVPCTRLTRTHSRVRCSRTSSRSAQKLSAGYYAASGSHRERSGPSWQRGKEGAEKNGSREEDKRRRTRLLRSSPRLRRTTSHGRVRGRRESSPETSSSSNDVAALDVRKRTAMVLCLYPEPAHSNHTSARVIIFDAY